MSKTSEGVTHGNKTAASLFVCILILIAVPAMAQLPDLIINKPRLAASVEVQRVTFTADQCSVVEGCVPGEGLRKLLKFDVGFQNNGAGDLVIGDPNARPDLFEFSPCHGHFHMHGVASYELLNAAGDAVLSARKQGWCFRDNNRFRAGAGPAKYDCSNQGITAGWEDIYDKSLDCQWLDITGIPAGNYKIRVVVNPDQVFQESNYDNNVVIVAITLGGAPQVTPPPTTPTEQPPMAKTPPPKKPQPKVQPAAKKFDNAWKKLQDKFKHKKPKKNNKAKGKGKAKPPIIKKPGGDDHDDDKHESGGEKD